MAIQFDIPFIENSKSQLHFYDRSTVSMQHLSGGKIISFFSFLKHQRKGSDTVTFYLQVNLYSS